MTQSVKNQVPVAVIMPVYNGETYIEEALNSILNQTVYPAEIWVVDDGSTDAGIAKARTFAKKLPIPLTVLTHETNQGLPAALNTGIRASSASLYMFLDADDLFESEAVQRLYEGFIQNQAPVVMGVVRQFVCSLTQKKFNLTHNHVVGGGLGCMLITKQAFEQVGFFEEDLKFGASLAWISKAKKQGLNIQETPSLILNRRLHDHNMSHLKEGRAYFLEIAKRNIARHQEAKKQGANP
ncbi:MAG: glycosyltransferase family 2 protein [Candidatus Margulisiibacteriota bacterium]